MCWLEKQVFPWEGRFYITHEAIISLLFDWCRFKWLKQFSWTWDNHPQLVDGCPSLSLVVPEFSSHCCQVLSHRGHLIVGVSFLLLYGLYLTLLTGMPSGRLLSEARLLSCSEADAGCWRDYDSQLGWEPLGWTRRFGMREVWISLLRLLPVRTEPG